MNTKIIFFLIIIISVIPITSAWGQTISDVINPKVDRELKDESNKIPGKAVVLVYSNTSWSGTASGGDLGSSTQEGSGDARFVVSCGDLGMAQGLFQKQTEGGYVAVVIIQNGKILTSEATNAAFGIAHAVANNCSSGFGGCLIATATYGSELAPQVQRLRELRDNTLLQTNSGNVFMTGFNEFYYSFSPTIADWERQNPIFKEAVKIGITPLLTSLSILNYVDMDSEAEVLGYGISLILLNIGMYIVVPIGIGLFLSSRKSKNS
jgi:hypothetical protein